MAALEAANNRQVPASRGQSDWYELKQLRFKLGCQKQAVFI